MSSETIREVSSEDMVRIGKIRSIRFTSGIVEFLYLLGLGMLLLLRVDYSLLVWYFLNQLVQGWLMQSKLKNSKQLQASTTNSVRNQIGLNPAALSGRIAGSMIGIGPVIKAFLLLWIFSLLKNPAKYSTGATWLLVAAIILVITVLFRYLVEPKMRALLVGLFMPVNVILWYLAIVHRNGLVLLFGAESIIVLLLTIFGWFSFKPEEILNPKSGIFGKLTKGLGNTNLDKINKGGTAISTAMNYLVETRYGKPLSSQYSHATNNKGVKITTEIRYKFSPEVLEQHPNMEQEIRDFLQDKFPKEYAELKVLDINWQGVILDDDDEED